MNVSVTSTHSETLARSSASGRSGLTESDSSNENSSGSAGDRVSISGSAKALYVQSTAAERQAAMTQDELRSLYSQTNSELVAFGHVIANRDYNRAEMLPDTDDPERLETVHKAIDYAHSLAHSPSNRAPNPFEGLDRKDLSGIVYDDTGTFTTAERYAAYGEMKRQDYDYFSKLAMAREMSEPDRREYYKGILDYLDGLSPVEKVPYKDTHRDTMNGFLQAEIHRWGPIGSDASSNVLLGQLMQQEDPPSQMPPLSDAEEYIKAILEGH